MNDKPIAGPYRRARPTTSASRPGARTPSSASRPVPRRFDGPTARRVDGPDSRRADNPYGRDAGRPVSRRVDSSARRSAEVTGGRRANRAPSQRVDGLDSRHSSGAPPSRHYSTSPPRRAPSGSAVYRAKRVRAGSVPAKPRKQRTGPKPVAAAAPPTAPILSEKQRRHLRGVAHDLKPLIRLGNAGLTDAVAAETTRALHDHELIKVKAPGGGDREARDAIFTGLAQRTASALIHRIGNVAVLYRPNATLPKILIPDKG